MKDTQNTAPFFCGVKVPYLFTKRCLVGILIALLGISVYADDGQKKSKVGSKDDETKLWGYVNKEDSCSSSWFKRSNRVSFGFLGITGGSKNDMLQQGYEKEWVIAPQYDEVSKYFSEGLAAVELHGRVGFIDSLNRYVIEPKFEAMDNLEGFSMGLAAVKMNGKYGFINKKGVFVIRPEYDYAKNFGDNKLATIKQGNKFGAINLNGEIVVECKYVAEPAMTTVPLSNKPYRKAVKQAEEDFKAGKFSKTLEVIQSAAEEVDRLIADVEKVSIMTQDVVVKDENGFKGGYLLDGTCVLSPIYDEMVRQDNHMFLLKNKDKWGIGDAFGRIILPVKYDSITYEPDVNVIVVKEGDRMGLHNATGRMLLPPCLDQIERFVGDEAIAHMNGEIGFLNPQGEFTDSIVERAFVKAALWDERGGKRSEVQPLYQQVLLARPDFAMAHNNIGIIEIENEEYKTGINRMKVANKLAPENKEIEDNLEQAKKDRRERRWNRVEKALEVTVTVLTLAAVTYTAVETAKGNGSNFVPGTAIGSDGGYESSGNGGNNSRSDALKQKSKEVGHTSRYMNSGNYSSDKRAYSNWESQIIQMNTYPERYSNCCREAREIQSKMRSLRQRIINNGGSQSKSPWEDQCDCC